MSPTKSVLSMWFCEHKRRFTSRVRLYEYAWIPVNIYNIKLNQEHKKRKDVSWSSGGRFLLTSKMISKFVWVIVCGNKRTKSYHLQLLLYRFQFQTSFSVSEHSFSHSYSLRFLWLYSSLSFRANLASFNVHHGVLVLNETVLFVRFFIEVVIWWVWICSRYADLRMIKQVVVLMMIVSLIRLILCVSAVAIISPHLLLPIYSQMLFFSATYTLTMLYATGLSYLFATFSSVYSRLNFSVSLNDHFCVILITWSHFS